MASVVELVAEWFVLGESVRILEAPAGGAPVRFRRVASPTARRLADYRAVEERVCHGHKRAPRPGAA